MSRRVVCSRNGRLRRWGERAITTSPDNPARMPPPQAPLPSLVYSPRCKPRRGDHHRASAMAPPPQQQREERKPVAVGAGTLDAEAGGGGRRAAAAGEGEGMRVTLSCLAVAAGVAATGVAGAAVLVWWAVVFHQAHEQLWMVPVGLVLLGTPLVAWLSLFASGACRRLGSLRTVQDQVPPPFAAER